MSRKVSALSASDVSSETAVARRCAAMGSGRAVASPRYSTTRRGARSGAGWLARRRPPWSKADAPRSATSATRASTSSPGAVVKGDARPLTRGRARERGYRHVWRDKRAGGALYTHLRGHRSPPPSDRAAVLLCHVIMALDAPELVIRGERLLPRRSGECLRVRGAPVRADSERQSSAISPHQLLKESFRRGYVAFRGEHELELRSGFPVAFTAASVDKSLTARIHFRQQGGC